MIHLAQWSDVLYESHRRRGLIMSDEMYERLSLAEKSDGNVVIGNEYGDSLTSSVNVADYALLEFSNQSFI